MIKTDRSIRLVLTSDQKMWDKKANHPLQSWAWGEFRKSMGIDVVRLGVYEKNALVEGTRPKLVEGWQLTFHKIPHTPFTIGYFPKGPLPTKKMVKELIKLGHQKHAIFIQLEPNVINHQQFNNSTIQQFLRPSHHPLFPKYTFVLDLTKSEDELLKAMSQKTRYNIKVAQKHGVVVKNDHSDSSFRAYLQLSEETTKRQGFFAHNRAYHERMWNTMSDAGIAHLFTASYNDTILATWIVFVWNDTVYYPYGASSRNNREVMAPTLLLWEIARWAKKKRLTYFDLWGALAPLPSGDVDTNDPWYGFHRFKEGYRPNLVESIGSFDLILSKALYAFYTLADTIRWSFLRFKS